MSAHTYTTPRPWLKAYAVGSTEGWSIDPAPPKRAWMDETFKRMAYRCLPLVAANQAGWVVRCPAHFIAEWSGRLDNRGVHIAYSADSAHLTSTAVSHFGNGVLTFVLPWLFRTSPGFGLLLRGLTNDFKPDAVPLDAVIETDWSPYTFTMNWKIVRGGARVEFKKGDAVCMIQPFPLPLLEQVDCSFEPFSAAPQEIREGFDDFVHRRSANLAVAPQGQYETQRDYFAGRFPDGSPARYPQPLEARGCPVAAGEPEPARAAHPDVPCLAEHRTGFALKQFTS